MDRDKIIKGLECCTKWMVDNDINACDNCPYHHEYSDFDHNCIGMLNNDILALLKEQEQIKSPDEFKSLLLGMFDSIWDVEIDHPIFQDTVGELMEGVLQAYRQAVKWDELEL